MSETSVPIWRSALDIVVDSISAERFRKELAWLREEHGNAPDDAGMAYTAMLTELFVESTGLFAALHLPLKEVPAALVEIRQTLAHLDFDTQRKHLKRNERHYYDCFASRAAPLFAKLGEAMEALFNCYVSGDYDPAANPDDLVVEALETAGEDLPRARYLITQAGAIALHSRPLWWRWQAEAAGPAGLWLIAMVNLVDSYTGGGQKVLGLLEQVRAEAERSMREAEDEIEEVGEEEGEEEAEPPAPTRSPMDDLTGELIQQGENGFTPDHLALCQAHREEAIPVLIDLATDEHLQMEDAPGDGYAPISAVHLLGELKAVEAIPHLIDVVADADQDAIIAGAAVHALRNIGPPALAPVLAFMRYSWDVETKTTLVEVVDEFGQRDEETYQTLVAVWEEATWAEGKCLLAHPLVRTGGEQAIPLLEAALEDPELENLLDYNEIANALEELGVEAPPPPEDLEAGGDFNAGDFVHFALLTISAPEHLSHFADTAPEEWRSHPDDLAHLYAAVERDRLNTLIALQAITLPEVFTLLTSRLLEAVETLTFDAPTGDHPRWLRQAYAHLSECAGPELQRYLAGALLSLHHYLSKDYDITTDPDQLLAAARGLAANDEEQRRLFGQAGALALHGRPFWSLWPDETDHPLSDWLRGLIRFRDLLGQVGQIPLHPSTEIKPAELVAALAESLEERMAKEAPPAIAQLLDVLVTQNQDTLSPAQRRRFVQQRAAVVPYLIRIVEGKWYQYEDSPGGGWAAILAVRVLGELKATQAIEALVRVVADSEPQDIVHDAALFSLMAIGSPAFPAVEAYVHYGCSNETKTSLAEVLGCIGQKNPNTFALLRQVWEATDWSQNRRMVALAFGDLRDQRALPLLRSALQDQSADRLDVDYVQWALRQLGAQAPSPSMKKSSRLITPAPYNHRLFHDEFDVPQRARYTAWGEPLCPDCGQPLVQDESGNWTHPPEQPSFRPASGDSRHRRREKKHH